MKKYVLKILLLAILIINTGNALERVLFDTDIGPDYDDVGATATLHTLAKGDTVEILAMAVSSGGHSAIWGPQCLDAINTFYGKPDIPIGVAENGPEFGSSYNQQIAQEFDQDIGTENVWDAVDLYRKILSDQPDSSVTIISVGFITNISELLKSEPDSNSSLNGIELVKKKVKKWVCMGGGFPSSGGEFNFNRDASSTKIAVENWPVPVLFSGFEIGNSIKTGAKLAMTSESNPIRRAYELAGGYVGATRSSWDQTAVLAAIRDPFRYWDLVKTGYCHVNDDGSNEWKSSPDKQHSYLVKKVPDSELEEIIDNLMANVGGLPEVEIISPTSGSTIAEGSDLVIEASASDPDGNITKVEFHTQNIKLEDDFNPPYSITWTDIPKGGYFLKALVTDDKGNTTTSNLVKIFVGDINRELVGHWEFNENVIDSSDHYNHGHIYGSPEFVSGYANDNAIKFNTEEDYVEIPESPDFSVTSFTVSARVKIPNSIPDGWRTIVEHNRWGQNWFGIWKSANGKKFHFRWTNHGIATSDFSTTISPNQWYYVAATYDSSKETAKMYLDGKLDKTIENAAIPKSVDSKLRIGLNLDGGEYFNGIIDDVRIYNHVLSNAEIQDLLKQTAIKNQNGDDNNRLPQKYSLFNYPNPFNSSTTIQYRIPLQSNVKIAIYNLQGEKLKILMDTNKQAGTHKVKFDSKALSSGIYLYRIQSDLYSLTKRMVILK